MVVFSRMLSTFLSPSAKWLGQAAHLLKEVDLVAPRNRLIHKFMLHFMEDFFSQGRGLLICFYITWPCGALHKRVQSTQVLSSERASICPHAVFLNEEACKSVRIVFFI